MDRKNMAQAEAELKKTYYLHLKQQQCALNMQIRLAMQTYDPDMKARLEKELEKVSERIRSFGG